MSIRAGCPQILLAGSLLMLGAFAPPALAEWRENGARILTVRELLPRVRATASATILSGAADPAPVLFPPGADPDDPTALRVALVRSGVAMVRSGGQTTLTVADAASEQRRAAPRLRQFNPMAPVRNDPRAVATGSVALFGRPLEAPFLIERVGETIQVNHVVVYPLPGIDLSGPVRSAAVANEHTKIQAVMAGFADRTRLQDATLRARAVDELLSIPGVTSAEWVDDETLRMTKSDGDSEELEFSERREPEPKDPDQVIRRLDAVSAALSRVLRNGGAIACGATYLVTMPGPDGVAFRNRVREIRSSVEPAALKLARIQAWTGRREAAEDLLWAR